MSESHRPAPPTGLIHGSALFLDFDGTLVELAEAPDAIRVPGELHLLLHDLADRLEGRLAIVSGRALADLDRHLPGQAIAMSGSHGMEVRLADGTQLPLALPRGVEEARAEIRAFASGREGLLVEEKPASIAVHFRRAPEREGEVLEFLGGLADRTGLRLLGGKMVGEVRPPGADKGDAVRAFLAEPVFAGARPVFVGDDLTDEHAFAAAAELGGAGILVGPERATAARYRLDGVAAVADWLRGAL
ncbi:MAG: trehalose-phosphatase [Allosphingosinicella sp.]|uniref:trehalose-phosphatase n=1 Tax=Allosphingosinicella sp. TaxID=2823234 RepID=UPI0039539C8A